MFIKRGVYAGEAESNQAFYRYSIKALGFRKE